jgi:hypothetical protein
MNNDNKLHACIYIYIYIYNKCVYTFFNRRINEPSIALQSDNWICLKHKS